MYHLHNVLQHNHYSVQFLQQGKFQVFMLYIKCFSEQYKHTLGKHRARVFFKGASNIKSLLMDPKDPIPDAEKTDTTYHWKSPVHIYTAKCIGETNRSLKERVSDCRNQATIVIRNYHISTKHPKSEHKNFKNNR